MNSKYKQKKKKQMVAGILQINQNRAKKQRMISNSIKIEKPNRKCIQMISDMYDF